jgi:YbbR domain-containing protein
MASVSRNWPAKVISLSVAIVLFVFHRMNSLQERSVFVPLAVEGTELMMPASDWPPVVRLIIRGRPDAVVNVLDSDLEAYVDLSRYNERALVRVPVEVRKKGTALSVEGLEISVDPAEISLQVDRRVTKAVPIHARFRGRLAVGYEMTGGTLTPAEATIEGPEEAVNKTSEINTSEIDLGGRNASFTVIVRLDNYDNLLQIQGPGTAEFKGDVRRRFIAPAAPPEQSGSSQGGE